MLERRDRRLIVAILHVSLAETDEAIRECGVEFGRLLIFRDRDIELLLFVSGNSGLHVLGGLRRSDLPGEP